MGFLSKIKNTVIPHTPHIGDVYQSPMGDLVILLGHKLGKETVFWAPDKGVRTLNQNQFISSFARVQRKDDNRVITLDIGLSEATRTDFDKEWPMMKDGRPWDEVYHILSKKAVSWRLTLELRKMESNMSSYRTKLLGR